MKMLFELKKIITVKSLLLIRHAKSSWDFDTDDFDRSLSQRGEADAPAMAKRIKNKGLLVDSFVSSPARRAITTARLFANEYEFSKTIVEIPTLYEPTNQAFINAIGSLNNEDNLVALFSHNPGITEFANTLTSTHIDDMPTCAIFAIHIHIDNWIDFQEGKKEFWFIDFPKAE